MAKSRTIGSSPKHSQISLPLPEIAPCYDRQSFIVAEPNEAAWRAARRWLDAKEPVLIVCGPPGAGKTHLAAILAAEAGGAFHRVADLNAPASRPGLVVLDDMPPADPQEFLAALEDHGAADRRVVLVGRGHPAEWSGGLKDLRTRLEAMPRASLGEPDEALIRRVIAKAFRDRQIEVSPAVIEFAAPRLARTFAAAQAFVALADRMALDEKRKISLTLAQSVIGKLSEGDPAA